MAVGVRRPAAAGLLTFAMLLIACAPASAGTANAGVPGAPASNPLAGLPWGNYSGPLDEVFPAYRAATGTNKRLLAKIALRPRVRWFGAWYGDNSITSIVDDYLSNVTGDRSNVLAQMAVFRLEPWEDQACHSLPTQSQQASYKLWVDRFARAIGTRRVALILQPDLPIALCSPHHSTLPLQLVTYAAQRFNTLSHTTVYIDAGSADWPTVKQAAHLLEEAGVRYVRGFALNATHYDSTTRQISFGAAIVHALARDHIPGRHFVINTAANGRPFTYQQYHGSNFANAAVCRTMRSRRCVTLGIPPTWHVTDSRWRLPATARAIAGREVDAYLWFGRPWLENQADPFDLQRSLALARTTPF